MADALVPFLASPSFLKRRVPEAVVTPLQAPRIATRA
jgi:hypothetical protein